MSEKPTYKELEQRVKKLEKEFIIRKRTEEALRESEATLRSIFLAAPTGIGTVCDRVIRQANERLCEMIGYSNEELLGKNARILYPSDEDFEYVGREKYAQISKQGTGTVETRWQCKDGKVIDVLLSSTPIDPNDWSTGVTFTALDITERKKAEKALDESEARYRALFENMIGGIAVYEAKDNGEDFIFVDLNNAGEKISATSKANVIGRSVLEMFPGVKDFGLFEVFQDVWRTGQPARHPTKLYKDNRISHWVENAVYKLPSGEIATVYSDETKRRQAEESLKQAHDELERRVQKRTAELAKINEQLKQEIEMHQQTEAALLKSETKYRNLFNNAQVGLFQARVKDGKILECNDKFAQTVGYETWEKCCADFITAEHYLDPGDREQALAVIEETGKIENFETCGMRRDGSRFWVRYSGVLNREEGFLEGVIVDITEEKRAEEALRESETLYRSLFTETRAVMLLIDPESGDIIDANPAACSYYGYSWEEITGRKILDFNTLPQEQVFYAIEKAVPEKQQHFNFRHCLANGDVRDVEVYTNPIKIEGKSLLFSITHDITKRKQAEEALQKRETELEIQSQHLQEVNSALKVLLQQREEDKKELQENIVANVKELVAPYLDKLSQGKLDERQKSYISLAQTNLNDIISPFIGNLSSKYLKLTPTEIQVANQIKHGKTTKEIAELLNLSVETIKFHRKNIRGKIGIKNKKVNLRTCLASMHKGGGK